MPHTKLGNRRPVHVKPDTQQGNAWLLVTSALNENFPLKLGTSTHVEEKQPFKVGLFDSNAPEFGGDAALLQPWVGATPPSLQTNPDIYHICGIRSPELQPVLAQLLRTVSIFSSDHDHVFEHQNVSCKNLDAYWRSNDSNGCNVNSTGQSNIHETDNTPRTFLRDNKC